MAQSIKDNQMFMTVIGSVIIFAILFVLSAIYILGFFIGGYDLGPMFNRGWIANILYSLAGFALGALWLLFDTSLPFDIVFK